MARYINADVVKDELQGARIIKKPQFLNADEALFIIDNQPTADVVEVKHGEWMEHEESFYDGEFHSEYPMKCYKCSECGRVLLNKEPYCNCGAKMNDKE